MKYLSTAILVPLILTITAAADNLVLDLDGKNSYVQLPADIYLDLHEATIEAWVKWKKIVVYSQPLGFGKPWNTMAVNNWEMEPILQFYIYDQQRRLHLIRIPNILQTNRWYHLAAVTGSSGMKLYLNGVLVGEHGFTGSFSAIDTEMNFFGRSQQADSGRFTGQLDEVRVWRMARTPGQIRANMHRRLSGHEPGLVGLWNFDAADARDASARKYHGQMFGTARCVAETLPDATVLQRPSVITGMATDAAGKHLVSAEVRLLQGGEVVQRATTSTDGKYQLIFFPNDSDYDLVARHSDNGGWWPGLRVKPGVETNQDLVLEAANHISGTVSTYASTPHVAVPVDALLLDEAGLKEQPPELRMLQKNTVLTDVTGKYRVTNLKPGSYLLRCHVLGGHVYYLRSGEETGAFASPLASQLPPQAQILSVDSSTSLSQLDFEIATFKKSVFRTLTRLDGLPDDDILALHHSPDGILWIGTGSGVSAYDGETLVNFNADNGFTDGQVRDIHETGNQNLWFATNEGVYRYDRKHFVRLTTADGLSADDVFDIHADSLGRLWFATQGGVSRYDGKHFVNFTIADGLMQKEVVAITADAAERIWIGHFQSGVARFDGEKFISLTKLDGLVDNHVQDLFLDSAGQLWFATDSGVCCYDGTGFVKLTTADGLVYNGVQALLQTSDGVLWFATIGGGVSRYDGQSVVNFTTDDGLPPVQVWCMEAAPDGAIWFGTEHGLVRYEEQTFSTLTIQDGLIDNWVTAIAEGAASEVWIGTPKGLSRLLACSQAEQSSPAVAGLCPTLVFSTADYRSFAVRSLTLKDGLLGNQINAIYRDAEGKMWFASAGKGVSCYDGKSFVHLTEDDGLISSEVHDVAQDAEGTMWFATQYSVSRFRKGEFTNFGVENGLPSLPVFHVHPDQQGRVWFSTPGDVFYYDGVSFTGVSEQYGLKDDAVGPIYSDTDSRLWLGASRGIWRLDEGMGVRLTTPTRLGFARASGMAADDDGRLWLTTDVGLLGYDGTAYSLLDRRDGLPDDNTTDIYLDAEGIIWFGTTADGLVLYRRTTTKPRVRITALEADDVYTDVSAAPPLAVRRLVTISYSAIDFKTHPQKRQYRRRLRRDDGVIISDWQVTKSPVFKYRFNDPGNYLFEVVAIDRDLNYSDPAQITLTLFTPWYLNAWLLWPLAGGGGVLLMMLLFLSGQYFFKLRETKRLREELMKQEQENRQQLEAKNQELEVANQAKSIFLANTSHEIRTPMNAILGYTQILQENNDLTADVKAGLKTIETSGVHLLALLNDILDITKIESGRLALQVTEFNLGELIEGISAMFAMRCQQKGLSWGVEWYRGDGDREAPSSPHEQLLAGDEGKLRQVLINLLGNAVKFTDAGSVTLRINLDTPAALKPPAEGAENSPGTVHRFTFAIIDTGPGIPEAAYQNILEPFTQETLGEQKGGTGLGLSIANQFIQLLGGELQLESTLGEGSRFWFTLQFPEAQISSVSPAPVSPSAGVVKHLAEGYAVKALVVDDIKENRDVLSPLLTRIGVEVKEADTGQAALEQLAAEKFDIVFMDIRMPQMDGIEATRRIIAAYGEAKPKLVAVSASALLREQQQYLEAGFDDFLAKPVQVKTLYPCLARMLRIKYQYANEANEIDHSSVVLPPPLLRRLKEAAGFGEITNLERYLDEVRPLSPQLAEKLFELTRELKMADILALLEALEGV